MKRRALTVACSIALFSIASYAQTTPTHSAKPAKSAALNALERFIESVQHGSGEFTQTVTTPARDGGKERVRQSRGTLEFARPNRFRLSYAKPFEQVIASDGQTLALHDIDLNQLTLRKASGNEALQGSAAALIASGASFKSLQEQFKFSEITAPEAIEGVVWVQAEPKTRDGQIQRLEIALRADTLALVQVRMLDSLGQRSVLRFTSWSSAAPAATRFRIDPPPGVDVVRQ